MATALREPVDKAQQEWRHAYRLVLEFLDKVALPFFSSWTRAQSRVTEKLMRQAARSRKPKVIIDAVFPRDYEKSVAAELNAEVRKILQKSGAAEYMRSNIPLKFDVVNPYSVKWINQHTAKTVKRITKESRLAIRRAVRLAFQRGYTVQQTAQTIRSVVGLHGRYAMAVMNRREWLLEQGVSPKRAQSMSFTYAKKLLRLRAQDIARTEIIEAESMGQLHAWKVARKEGYVTSDAKQEWIADPVSARTCKTCRELHGKQVGLDEEFPSEVLGRNVSGPPAHSKCRCARGLVTPT